MTKIIRFTDAEVAEPTDFEAISIAAREGDENIVGGAVGYPNHWADFTIAAPSSVTLTVNPGRYFVDATVFDLDGPLDLDMQVHLPLVVGDQRYVAVLARGVSEVVNALRMIETDVDTGETVQTSVPKVDRRRVEFVVQQGVSSPTPLRPTVAANDCCICFVLLSATGIVAIESGEDWRVKTLYEVEGRVRVLEGQMIIAFARTTTLASDLANLQARYSDVPRPEVIRQLQRDVSMVRRRLTLPAASRAYWYDPGLVRDAWDFGHPNWLARIRDGVRFPPAAERDARLEVLDPGSPAVTITNDLLLPKWTEEVRLEVTGSGSTKNISSQVHTVVTAVERTISRSATSYGPPVAACENNAEWSQVGSTRVGEVFQVAGETFQNLGVIGAPGTTVDVSQIQSRTPEIANADILAHNALPEAQAGHLIFAAQSVQTYSWTETYWDYVTNTFGVNGSTYAQSFLVTQPMLMTSIELNFARKADTGDVHLILCEVNNVGLPIFDAVLARKTLTPAEISTGWTKFSFRPTFLPAGRRYAWLTVTSGNHALATVTGAVYAQGTLFWSTDGAWSQGAPEEDFAFRINAAKFAAVRTVVEFTPVTLENGVAQLDLNYSRFLPSGTSIAWEVQPSGSTVWTPIGSTDLDTHPFAGLPPLVRLRATLLGTPELAPAIELSIRGRAVTSRPRVDATAITKQLDFGLTTTSIVAEIVVDTFDPALHTLLPRLIVGGVTVTASVVTQSVDPSRASRRTFTATFAVSSTTNARLRLDLTSTSALRPYFVQNCSVFAL